MKPTTRSFADVGAIALAASVLFSGLLLPMSAQAVTGSHQATTSTAVIDYVALGDSYAAGQGAPPYKNACLQSSFSYPAVLDAIPNVKLVADPSCSGATTTDVTTRQLGVLTRYTGIDVVTVTVGANDLGVAAITAQCSVSFTSPGCQAALASAQALLAPRPYGVPSKLAVRLGVAFAGAAAASRGAAVLVTGYPLLFETPPVGSPNYAAVTALNSATLALNSTIKGVADRLAAARVNIRYVDVTAAFLGHGIGSADPWINVVGVEAFHPTAVGYQAYAAAVRARF